MQPLPIALRTLAAFAAGAVNSIAGGGTLLTFPSLIGAGLSSIAANATSTVALVPGSLSAWISYARHGGEGGAAAGGRGQLALIGVASVLGGLLGATLVLEGGEAFFRRIVPFLIFGATALFVAQDALNALNARASRRAATAPERRPPHAAVVFCAQFVIAIYGGFFGAGIGILMLAGLGMLGYRDIHEMNRLKNFAAVCINGIAAVTFIASGRVVWTLALAMAVGAILGGYAGAGVARRIGQRNVRRAVVLIGVTMGLVMLARA